MELRRQIILVSFATVLLLAILLSVAGGGLDRKSDFFMIAGTVGFICGLLQLVAGLLLLIKTDKRYAQAFLISAGILMLTGFTTCTAFINLNMH